MIHDLTMLLNERTLPFPAGGGEPHLSRQHVVTHDIAGCQVTQYTFGSHLGTHVDAPLHFLREGRSIAEIDLHRFFGPAVCLELEGIQSGSQVIDLSETLQRFKKLIRKGDILVFSTGWERKAGTPEFFLNPAFAENTGALLKQYGAVGIGIDMPSVCNTGDIHRDILGRGMSIIESLVNLKPLIGRRFLLSALPLNIPGGDGCPVRACALLPDDSAVLQV